MAQKRPQQVASLVHGELARLLREDLSDPRVGQLSITDVSMSADLKRARVRVLPLGGGEVDPQLMRGLEAARGYLRHKLGRSLGLRFTPALDFELDRNLAHAVQLTSMLGRLVSEEGAEE